MAKYRYSEKVLSIEYNPTAGCWDAEVEFSKFRLTGIFKRELTLEEKYTIRFYAEDTTGSIWKNLRTHQRVVGRLENLLWWAAHDVRSGYA